MDSESYEVLEVTEVQNHTGLPVHLAPGPVLVSLAHPGYLITSESEAPVTVSELEFDRLVATGQMMAASLARGSDGQAELSPAP